MIKKNEKKRKEKEMLRLVGWFGFNTFMMIAFAT